MPRRGARGSQLARLECDWSIAYPLLPGMLLGIAVVLMLPLLLTLALWMLARMAPPSHAECFRGPLTEIPRCWGSSHGTSCPTRRAISRRPPAPTGSSCCRAGGGVLALAALVSALHSNSRCAVWHAAHI